MTNFERLQNYALHGAWANSPCANETDTGVAAGGIGRTIGDAVIAFNKANVMMPLVNSKQANPGSTHVQFADYTKIATSAVAAATDGSDHTTNAEIATAARTATISEHVIRAEVTDLAVMGNADDLTGNTGAILGNAVAAKLDADLTALGTGFSQTVAGAGTALAISHIFDSMRQLRAAGAPMPYNLVLSPKQVWGAKGLISLTHNTAIDTAGSSTTDTATARGIGMLGSVAEQAMQTGYIGSIAGFNVYWSDQIEENVSSGGDAAGFAFSKGAVGLAVGVDGLFRIETERNASMRSTEYIAVGFWGEIEIKDAFGVYCLTDVS